MIEHTERVIDSVAGVMAEHIVYDISGYTYADAERINAHTGWTIEWSGSLGSVVRHEGIRLDDAELLLAWTRALAIVEMAEGA